MTSSLPRRFYSRAHAVPHEGGHGVMLDARVLRTPSKTAVVLPQASLAQALAHEWDAQVEVVNPAIMPLTRIINAALDGVAKEPESVIAEITRYGASDLVCYRSDSPAPLVARQALAWDPVLVFALDQFGASLELANGIVHVQQPQASLTAIEKAVRMVAQGDATGAALRLAALHVMTSLTGSVLIPLMLSHGAISPDAAFAAAHVDEDYQMELWGQDEEALARRSARWQDMQAAAKIMLLSQPQSSAPPV